MVAVLTAGSSFPDPRDADEDGIVAVGGDLSPERLLAAYRTGIFPWPMSLRAPMFWFSPDPRYLLLTEELHVTRAVRRAVRRGGYTVTLDRAFDDVIRMAARVPRRTQPGTWILPTVVDAFVNLHELGFAHSVELWRDGSLVAGLYGVSIGGAFGGESMFTHEPDMSKVALATLTVQLRAWNFDFVDCQTPTDHTQQLGARAFERSDFLDRLDRALLKPTRLGPWSLELDDEQLRNRLLGTTTSADG